MRSPPFEPMVLKIRSPTVISQGRVRVLVFGLMRMATHTANLAAALFMVFTTMATAQTGMQIDVSALGPQVGEPVPDFDLPDQNGIRHTIETVRGPNGSLILFHRSADW